MIPFEETDKAHVVHTRGALWWVGCDRAITQPLDSESTPITFSLAGNVGGIVHSFFCTHTRKIVPLLNVPKSDTVPLTSLFRREFRAERRQGAGVLSLAGQ
jgi:hypothetical protein